MILDAHWRPLQGKAIPLKDLQIKQKPKLIFFLQMPGNRVSNTLETKFFWGRHPTTPPPPPPPQPRLRAFGARSSRLRRSEMCPPTLEVLPTALECVCVWGGCLRGGSRCVIYDIWVLIQATWMCRSHR